MSNESYNLEEFFGEVISQLGGTAATVNLLGSPYDGRYEFMAAVCGRCHRVEMSFRKGDSKINTVQMVVSLMLATVAKTAVNRAIDLKWKDEEDEEEVE